MKKLLQALFIVFCTVALGVAVYYFIQTKSAAAEANRPLTMRKLVLDGNSGKADKSGQDSDHAASLNRIAALPNEVILDVLSVNLDQDEGDEQIITVRKTDRSDDRLCIVVADYVPQRHGWVRAWEGETRATKFTTFQIQTVDLIGDHNLDIVCTGMDNLNDQTMTAFRRVKGGDPELISFAPICSLAADSIVIDTVDRTEGYQLGQTNGASFPIEAYQHDTTSQNLLDQVKTEYVWDNRGGAYVAGGTEKIPGAQVEKEMAAKVLTGNEADFERFLQGAWCESDKDPQDPTARILVFDKPARSIIFFAPEDQEDFDWNESHSTRYGLYVSCQNESVLDLRRLMDIELTGTDTISIRLFEDLQMKVDSQESWDGSYRKMPPQTAGDAERQAATQPSFKLAGEYRGGDGSVLAFDGQNFSLKQGDKTTKGGFILYKLGADTVLQLSELQSSGLLADRKLFRARYSETKTGKSTARHLELSPARASIDGLELLQEPELSLDQR